ncbi:MAG TPA: pilus assembly protein TadG-related protein [Bryobacteraceae bacterium]|nr:pilus assembly protein TadG-related protein [Bryobacteraceae bacterium]
MKIRANKKNNTSSEQGSMVFLAALTIFVLFAFMGLALDTSYMYFHKRRMQTAADAAAFAGALETLRGNTSAVTAAARSDAALNSFTDGADNISVAVNRPPLSGSRAGNSQFVEVIISHPQPTWFMRALNVGSMSVQARAVAGTGNTNNGCVYALNRDTGNQNNGFSVNGTTNSSFSCGVFSNSNFRSVGGACVVTPSVSYTGSYSNQNTDGNCGPQSTGQGVPIVDPVANKFQIPSYTSCTHNNFRINGGTIVTVDPGVYCGGITITGSVVNVIFNPGEYILVGGGLQINGAVSVAGSNVTFFNTYPGTQMSQYAGIGITGSGIVTLTAPTSGPDKGLLFFQDPRVSPTGSNGSTIAGGATSVYNGMVYFPTTDLTYSGNSSNNPAGGAGYTMLIAYNVKIAGTATINADYSALGGSNPLQDAVFAE